MFAKILERFVGTSSERYLKKILHLVPEINKKYDSMEENSDEDLRRRTQELIQEIRQIREDAKTEAENQGMTEKALDDYIYKAEQTALEDRMTEAFALVKQACKRLLGKEIDVVGQKQIWDMVPFDVQLLGAIVLHRGGIAEMKTGEGKTLVATMPIFLNALTERGVHLVTVNDYLAERDSQWMGEVYRFLGLTVGKILNSMDSKTRQQNYACHITYGTNNEFGFDYLRDNMSIRADDVVQRGHYYAIVDEVDSVLIDEARTPLIISGPVESNTHELYKQLRPQVEKLVRAQIRLIAQMMDDIEKTVQSEEKYDHFEYGTKLLQVHRGLPKNRRLIKFLQEPGMHQWMVSTESQYMQEKRLHEVDDPLYYTIDEKNHVIDITEKGRQLLAPDNPEQFIIPDIGEEFAKIDEQDELTDLQKSEEKDRIQRLHAQRSETIHNINQLLRAYSLFEKDIEYVVQDGKVQIVDEFTGRVLPGRRYSDGLHQAIEAKENVRIEGENQTLATITIQNYFRMYDKLAGMTGTALTEADEFAEIYKLEVVSIPTHKPVAREDADDQIYKTKREKYKAIIDEIERCYKKGQPALVGTVSVDVSETLSRILRRTRIPHNVLNAKQHQREAEIVIRAGQRGAITIATNMAGRGTDIKISDEVRGLGGLRIIGTERHESRRIDLQLRGRSGRQGDPGSSVFFLSLEDDLMRLFNSERISKIMDRVGIEEGEVITHPMVSKSIERAQKKVEERNFSIRKHLLEYDDVMNKQREVIYDRRSYALMGGKLQEEIHTMMEEYIETIIDKFTDDNTPDDWDWDGLRQEAISVLLVDIRPERLDAVNLENLKDYLLRKAKENYQRKREIIPSEIMSDLERWATLRTIDEHWKEHLYELDSVKEGIGLQAYGQKDPLIMYKKEAYSLFGKLLDRINRDTLRILFQTEIRRERTAPQLQLRQARINSQRQAPVQVPGAMVSQAQESQARAAQRGKAQPYKRDGEKVGRNDPCPCGSGKKFKHCHGANG
ncbi:MAG TPA: preprotein translocase subunit SecA [Candidatus Marinimicrobia bacterium]|nr:preprotein translocase subunit SecA [Candidatus Neomarinimicrobiota bacterium]